MLCKLEWERPRYFDPHLTYLQQLDGTLARVDDWLLISPRLASESRIEASVLGSAPLSLVRRSIQVSKSSFGRIASVEHRTAAQRLIDEAAAGGTALVGPRTGVALLYPVVEGSSQEHVQAAVHNGVADPSRVVMAFTLIPPRSANSGDRRLVRFRAKNSRLEGEPTVPSGPSS